VTPWRTITRVDCHRVLEIDGRPALAVFLESLPKSYRDDLGEILPAVLAGLADPGLKGPPSAYVVRRLVGVDRKREAILVGDEVIPGTRFAIVVRDADAARRSLEEEVGGLIASSAGLAGALYFDDIERGEGLFGLPDVDFAYLRRQLGDIPLAGFSGSVELAPMDGRNRFHQFAGVVVGFEAASPRAAPATAGS
jgi:small ligand-binding sensory domain FIST